MKDKNDKPLIVFGPGRGYQKRIMARDLLRGLRGRDSLYTGRQLRYDLVMLMIWFAIVAGLIVALVDYW